MKVLICVWAILLTSTPVWAEMYKWTDNNGTVHFTDNPSNIPRKTKAKTLSRMKSRLDAEAYRNQAEFHYEEIEKIEARIAEIEKIATAKKKRAEGYIEKLKKNPNDRGVLNRLFEESHPTLDMTELKIYRDELKSLETQKSYHEAQATKALEKARK